MFCSYGRENDASILSQSAFGKLFDGGPSGLSILSHRLVGNSRLLYVLKNNNNNNNNHEKLQQTLPKSAQYTFV